MDTAHLKYFLTVAQTGSMTRASQVLHVSQPTLSKAIAGLEHSFGQRLFDRTGRKLRLNAFGLRVQECCARILQEHEAAIQDIQSLSRSDYKIRIGTVDVSEDLLSCLAEFRRKHEGVAFSLDTAILGDELPDINCYDVLIFPDSPRFTKFISAPLRSQQYYLAVPAAHPLANRTAVTSAELEGLDIVFYQQGEFLDYPAQVCASFHTEFTSRSFTDSRSTQFRFVSQGIAAAIVSDSWIPVLQNDPNIRLLLLLDNVFSRPLRICFQRPAHATPLAQRFKIDLCEFYGLPAGLALGERGPQRDEQTGAGDGKT